MNASEKLIYLSHTTIENDRTGKDLEYASDDLVSEVEIFTSPDIVGQAPDSGLAKDFVLAILAWQYLRANGTIGEKMKSRVNEAIRRQTEMSDTKDNPPLL